MTYIEISGFKGFDSLKIDGLKQINLITGLNNVGKTALLESLYLGINSDNSLHFLSCLYSIFMERGLYVNNYIKLESLFREENTITIKNDYNSFRIQKVKGSELSEEDKDLFIQSNNMKNQDFFSLEKADFFKFIDVNGKTDIGLMARVETMLNNLFDDNNYIGSDNIYLSSKTKNSNYLKFTYERVTSQFKEDELLKSMKLLDCRIEKLNIINDMLQVKLKTLSSYIPINELGDGFCRVVEILMNLYVSKQKVILVDEIENGIHYSKIKDVWKDIITTCIHNDIQLFATTHSKEFIDVLSEVSLALKFDNISIINLYKEDETICYTMVDSVDILANRIMMGLENR